MREIDKIAEGLFEKIRDRFEDVSLGDENAKATQDPERARFFNFDFTVDDVNLGNVTLSLIDEISIKIYFSKNISDDLDDVQRRKWYAFLREIRRFAKENLMSFEPRDITRSTLKHRDIQQVSKTDSTYNKDEVVAESLYGTRKSSYEKKGPVRIIVRHSKPLDEVENRRARTHHISNIYLETQEGERFKLPVKSLRLGRALAQHLKHGGSMQDDLGRHICEIAEECAKLKPFLNNTRHRTFEDTETHAMVEAAFEYHGLLNNTLKRMTGKKGYQKCKEQFVATSTSFIPEVDTDEMKQRFEKRTFDERLEEALPLVHKAYNMKKENKFTEQFVNWAETVAEGTWAVPDTDDEIGKLIDILSNPLPAGVDGQNATNILYDIIGDDRLFDQIQEIAKIDPEEDVRSVVENWLQDHLPYIYQQIEQEIGDPDYPAEPAEDNQEVDESKETRQALSDQHFKFPQQGQYGYRQGYKVPGVLELADGRTGKIINLGEFGHFEEDHEPNQKWLRIVFNNPNMDADAWDELEDMLWSDKELTESLAVKHLSDATAKAIISSKIDLYDARSGYVKLPDGEQELLQAMYDEIVIDTGLHPDDDFEKIDQRIYDQIEADYSHVGEGNTYGSGDGGMDGTVYEEDDQDDLLANIESIQSAIIRRILNNIGEHSELLKKAGPEGIMNASLDVAGFHAPMEEIGSSDISIMVREVYNEVGVEYPEDEVAEAKDKVTYDPKTGKLTGWEHEGDWKKQTKKKDPVGKIHHMSDVARRRTEKMAKDETLEEAFERLVNEDYNPMVPGDSASPLSYAQRDATERYCDACDRIEEECVCEDELNEDQMSEKIKTLIGQTVYVKSEGRMGKVLDIAPDFRNSVIVKVGNRETVSHVNDLAAQSPGSVKQTLDLIRSITGGGPTAPRKAKPGAQVQQGLIPQTPDAFKKSVGIKR